MLHPTWQSVRGTSRVAGPPTPERLPAHSREPAHDAGSGDSRQICVRIFGWQTLRALWPRLTAPTISAVINEQPQPVAGGSPNAADSRQPPAWYPSSAGPPQKTRPASRLLIVVGAVVAVVLAAGTGFTAVLLLRDHISTSSPARTQASPSPRDLAGYLLPVPDGATAWPGRPLTQTIGWGQADDLAAGQDDWRQQLQTNGFIDGVVRRWVDREGQQIEVALLRFPDGDSSWKVFESIVNYCTTGDVWTTQSGKMGALFATRFPDDQGHFLQMGANYAGDVLIKIRVGGRKTVDNAVVATMLQAQSTALG